MPSEFDAQKHNTIDDGVEDTFTDGNSDNVDCQKGTFFGRVKEGIGWEKTGPITSEKRSKEKGGDVL